MLRRAFLAPGRRPKNIPGAFPAAPDETLYELSDLEEHAVVLRRGLVLAVGMLQLVAAVLLLVRQTGSPASSKPSFSIFQRSLPPRFAIRATSPWSICKLVAQKLVYYAQGVHLAVEGEPMFDDPIEAWTHGPVVPDLYHMYKEYGGRAIPPVRDLDAGKYPELVREVLDEVYNVFGQFSAWRLRAMTHKEDPWLQTAQGEIITQELMKDYFRTRLVDVDTD